MGTPLRLYWGERIIGASRIKANFDSNPVAVDSILLRCRGRSSRTGQSPPSRVAIINAASLRSSQAPKAQAWLGRGRIPVENQRLPQLAQTLENFLGSPVV